jgi:hypothetical protein
MRKNIGPLLIPRNGKNTILRLTVIFLAVKRVLTFDVSKRIIQPMNQISLFSWTDTIRDSAF